MWRLFAIASLESCGDANEFMIEILGWTIVDVNRGGCHNFMFFKIKLNSYEKSGYLPTHLPAWEGSKHLVSSDIHRL